MTTLSKYRPDNFGFFSNAGRHRHLDLGADKLILPLAPSPEASGSGDKPGSPATHWRRRKKGVPIPADEAARQGDITAFAFGILGRDGAIDFLNAEHPRLGGRPIALATQSKAGEAIVRAELERRAPARPIQSHPE